MGSNDEEFVVTWPYWMSRRKAAVRMMASIGSAATVAAILAGILIPADRSAHLLFSVAPLVFGVAWGLIVPMFGALSELRLQPEDASRFRRVSFGILIAFGGFACWLVPGTLAIILLAGDAAR